MITVWFEVPEPPPPLWFSSMVLGIVFVIVGLVALVTR